MTYEEFCKKANKARTKAIAKLENDDYLPLGFPDTNNLIGFVKTGEADGGNCWGGTSTYQSFSVDESKKTYALKKIVKATAPDITFLAYDDLENLAIHGSKIFREYYGNYQEFDYCHLDNKTIYDFLKDRGFV